MPYKDPAQKTAQMKRWRKEQIEKGYGKWLYARRKLRFDDAEIFRDVLERIAEVAEHGRMTNEDRLSDISGRARKALEDSRKREEELGEFKSPEGG